MIRGQKQREHSNKADKATPRISHHYRPAFTIVELLIVVVVIAILAAISIVAYNGITNQSKDAALAGNLNQAAKKLATYSLQNANTLPADTTAFLAATGLTNTDATTYQYSSNTATTPNIYCITATTSGSSPTTSHIAGFSDGSINKPVPGPCVMPGSPHTGTAPTTTPQGDCPTNFIVVPGSSLYGTQAFCVMKYEAKQASATVPVSQAAGTPWVSITQTNAIAYSANVAGCTGCKLITEAEWMTLAANVLSVPSNWSTGTVGSGYIYSGHNDNAPANALVADTNDSNGYGTGVSGGDTGNTSNNQRRTLTLTNGEVIWDLAGNVREWTTATIPGNQQPGLDIDNPDGTTYSWKQWTAAGIQMNGLPQLSRPESVSAAAAAWSGNQGIGQLYSNQYAPALRAFRRGGTWDSASAGGVLALSLSYSPSNIGSYIGFRVSR